MAKFYGMVGYAKAADGTDGIWTDTIVERPYMGDELRNTARIQSGDKVKIVGGDFKGVEGTVARVSGQQRVVVEIQGLCLIATAYIPTAFIEPI